MGAEDPLYTGGRHRIYDYDKEAQDLDKWSKLDTSLRLYGFVNDKNYFYEDLYDFAKRNDNFAYALRKARQRIAQRREEQVSTGQLNVAVFNKTAHIYDKELVKYSREEDDYKADKQLEREIALLREKAKILAEGGFASTEAVAFVGEAFGIIDQLQALSSLRSKAATSIKADAKS